MQRAFQHVVVVVAFYDAAAALTQLAEHTRSASFESTTEREAEQKLIIIGYTDCTFFPTHPADEFQLRSIFDFILFS